MPHEPRRFIDKEVAEGMVYMLEEHFMRITAYLDACVVPKQDLSGGKLTVEQRVRLLGMWAWHKTECSDRALSWEELINQLPDMSDEIEDPEEVAEKIAALYEKEEEELELTGMQ